MPRSRRPLTFEVLNLDEITDFFIEMGKVEKRTVKPAARAGAVVLRKAAQSTAQLPVKYGFLRMSINYFYEGKSRKPGKAGYDVAFDRKYNFIFQKKIERPGLYGGKAPTGYYPASMEYGFLTKKGEVGGYHFLERTGREKESEAQDKMIEMLSKDIDRIKKGRR